VVGLREQNKAKRRGLILDAALELLRANVAAEVTVEQIAMHAGLSPATVYNLVGPRPILLAALVDRVIDDLVHSLADLATRIEGDPIEAARLIVDQSVAAFTAESAAFRRIVRERGHGGVGEGGLSLDPAQLQIAALRDAQLSGIIDPTFDAAGLGRQIFLSYGAAMQSWASGQLDDREFGIAARHGLLAVLAATATDQHRSGFCDELRLLSVALASASRAGPEHAAD
jgi:AcrR family transcriptional regulator